MRRIKLHHKLNLDCDVVNVVSEDECCKGLTVDTANAWHVSLNGVVNLTKTLLGLGMKYICLGKIQSDHLEGEFGVIRQLS